MEVPRDLEEKIVYHENNPECVAVSQKKTTLAILIERVIAIMSCNIYPFKKNKIY